MRDLGGGSRCRGWQAGEEATKIVQIRAFFQLQVKVLLGEIEVGEAVLIHEFDDFADFLEFHDKRRLVVGE